MNNTANTTAGNAPAFTPGPWRAGKPQGLAHWNIEGDGINIANVWDFVGSPTLYDRDGQGEANARLIAAAPELLGALKEALGVLAQVGERHPEYHGTKHGPSFVGAAHIRARAAIAKAEGRA